MPARAGLLLSLVAAAVFAAAFGGVTSPPSVGAQVFGPPMTIYGSVASDAGPVPEGTPVETFVGNAACGSTTVSIYGGVAVYWIDVVSDGQKPGCGVFGSTVRVIVGGRLANETAVWDPGPNELNLTVGNVEPIPVPTATPVPDVTAPATAPPPTPTQVPQRTPTPGASASPTSTLTATATRTSTPTSTPTLAGSLITRQPTASPTSSATSGGDGGFPIWAAVVIGVGAIVAVGGGIGFLMARSRGEEDDVLD